MSILSDPNEKIPNLPMEKIFMKIGSETNRSWQGIRTLHYKKRD
jgi:hypothetical protein